MDNVSSFAFSVCSSYMKMSLNDLLAIGHEIQSCLSGRGAGVLLAAPDSPPSSLSSSQRSSG